MAKTRLIERFALSEIQTKSILDMRLSRLVGLEKDTIIANIQALEEDIKNYEYILSSHEHVLNKVIDELLEIAKSSRITVPTPEEKAIEDIEKLIQSPYRGITGEIKESLKLAVEKLKEVNDNGEINT